MIRPPYLIKGDKIAIVAPARKVAPAEMENAIHTFRGWGLQVVTGQHLFGQDNQFSGTDDERRSDLQTMLDDTSVKAIIAARGGYGSVRLIDDLNFDAFVAHPKWIVGYSDLTALHSHIHTQLGIETLHAVMPINFPPPGQPDTAVESLRKALFGEPLEYEFAASPLNVTGKTSGLLTGGNLSMIYSIAGSVSDIDTHGKILFLEDIDEYLYHIDRMMMNLKRGGKLAKPAGIIVGGLTDMKDNTVPFGKNAAEIIASHVHELGIPVCFEFPAGHQPDNYALFFGRETQLEITANSVSVRFIDSGISHAKKLIINRILKTALYILGFFTFTYLALYLIRLFIK